jgi:hypothetical protein
MDFASFKKNKKNFIEKAKNMNMPKKDFNDNRFWTPTKDDAGNGEALFRFLPQKDVDKAPIILYYQHFFKERGKYFVEKCPTTWDMPCPICDYVNPMWDSGIKEDEDNAMKFGRKRQFISNIYMIKDPGNPENNGKVFLFKLGVKIFDKIMDKINPSSELDDEVMVQDLWEGMNFKLKVKKVYGYANYESSEFSGTICPVAQTDDEIEVIYNQIYSLDEFTDDKDCKTEKYLSDKFTKITGIKFAGTGTVAKKTEEKVVEEKSEVIEKSEPDFSPDETKDTTKDVVEDKEDDLDDEDWNWDDDD